MYVAHANLTKKNKKGNKMSKIAVIGFDDDGYSVFTRLSKKQREYSTILYYSKYMKDIITDFKYEWNFETNRELTGSGFERIADELLNYCNKKNPFNEKNINADIYIIFYNYFDLSFCNLINDIIRNIKKNNKKVIGVFSNPFSFEGKIRNSFCRNKFNEVKELIDKKYIYEDDEIGQIIKVTPPNLINESIDNINYIFYVIIKEIIENIKNNELPDISIKDIQNLLDKNGKFVKVYDSVKDRYFFQKVLGRYKYLGGEDVMDLVSDKIYDRIEPENEFRIVDGSGESYLYIPDNFQLILNSNIEIVKDNLTEMNVDAIVNAANNKLLRGGGLCGAIFQKAGYELDKECNEIGNCDTGNAVITKGYELKAKHIIHTVAPIWYMNMPEEEKKKKFRNCYKNIFRVAIENNIKTIAIPCIGTGIYQCPIDLGRDLAFEEANKVADKFEKIYFVCFRNEEYEIYKNYERN